MMWNGEKPGQLSGCRRVRDMTILAAPPGNVSEEDIVSSLLAVLPGAIRLSDSMMWESRGKTPGELEENRKQMGHCVRIEHLHGGRPILDDYARIVWLRGKVVAIKVVWHSIEDRVVLGHGTKRDIVDRRVAVSVAVAYRAKYLKGKQDKERAVRLCHRIVNTAQNEKVLLPAWQVFFDSPYQAVLVDACSGNIIEPDASVDIIGRRE